ncbi:hypothetical protein Cme02nite_70400 [Catellatospora methionotrophica]|uniref:Zinc-binding dehydrogenase n=1 Tax=Catellatospora methionotrophica TaxID=121620 RepID=A0A8J3PJQ3_9ACTN|nr:hypothetical protein [Catellatospora methionotrophica]GIG18708.1 hypothetical protein Cme02nite_70400 [Catellatospora methionotrophica]
MYAGTRAAPAGGHRLGAVRRVLAPGGVYLSSGGAGGRLSPVIERTLPLSETPDVLRALETDHARAKIVLVVPEH